MVTVPQDSVVQEIKKDLLLSGVTFSGGEPFCQAEGFYDLAVKIKKLGTGLDILIFTGYTYEELIELSEKDKARLLPGAWTGPFAPMIQRTKRV